jgi:ribosomal protein L18E
MEDILEFDPSTEFQVIDTFEFEELIQRPDELRLFTLEEQLLNYFDVRLPKGKVTRFQMDEISDEVDRLKDAYLSAVQPTDTLYDIKRQRTVRMPSWVHPMFDKFDVTLYDYGAQWKPLYQPEQRGIPQYFRRMISALPSPYRTTASENVPITENTTGRKDDETTEVKGLGPFEQTKTVIHEDGTRDIVVVGMANTSDDLRVKGYVLDRRALDLPNPLRAHPFLSSTEPSNVVTTEPFEEIYPSVDSILTHAVPTTSDPYTEGMKYLKLYDVRISEIPWSAWKSRFPPVDTIETPPPVKSVSFPTPDDSSKPSENLQKAYSSSWRAGIHPRLWLTTQEDSGTLVSRMLLSKVGEAGNVSVDMVGELIDRVFPNTTPEECIATNSFQSFLESGLSRYTKDGKFLCVPIPIIQQERREAITLGRVAWSESVEQKILRDYQQLLERFKNPMLSDKIQKYEAAGSRKESQLRKDILVLLQDPHRTPSDKADAIEVLLKDSVPDEKKVYLDADKSFIVCSHTLSVLHGDMERNPGEFYREWTTTDLGMSVCKSCGEHIGQVFTTHDEFDNDGHLIVSFDTLPTSSFNSESNLDTFTVSLRELKKVINTDHAGEVVLYIILSLLQVLPAEAQLLPVLSFIRELSKALKSIAQKKKISADAQNRVDGILGLAGAIILLQTHQPFLIPRRAFGSKPIMLSGYPRDTADPQAKGIIDSLLHILKVTFEAFPGTFTGNILPFIRSVSLKTRDVREEANKFLQTATTKFKAVFESAKINYTTPIEEAISKSVALPVIQASKVTFAPKETVTGEPVIPICKSVKPMSILEAKNPPVTTQKPLALWDELEMSPTAKIVRDNGSNMIKLQSISADEIRRRITVGFPKNLKLLESLKVFLAEAKDGVSILSVVARLLDLLSKESTFPQDVIGATRSAITGIQTKISPSLLRDVSLGFAYSVLKAISDNKNVSGLERMIQGSIRRDVVLRMVMIKQLDAEKTERGLRARERETLKQRLRKMNDTEREITKKLLDIGIAPYIITNQDREMFSKELNIKEEADVLAEGIVDENQPAEGYNDTRDYIDDELPVTETGQEMNVDVGEYGDRSVRDYNDYTTVPTYDDTEGYGN